MRGGRPTSSSGATAAGRSYGRRPRPFRTTWTSSSSRSSHSRSHLRQQHWVVPLSSYAAVPAGTWTMSATGSSGQAGLPVTLAGNTVHTEVVLDGSSGLEIVNLTDAAGAGQPPAGGVNTGFGGTAPHGPGSPILWLAVIGAGLLLVVTGGIGLNRSRLRRLAA